MNDLNTPPVEMVSEGFSMGSSSYGDENEPPLTSGEKMYDFVLDSGAASTSFVTKVRLYSLDVNKPKGGYADSCTLSIGNVDIVSCVDIIMAKFKSLTLRMHGFSISLNNEQVQRISYTEETDRTCSLILDVSLPSIVKLEMGE